MLRASAAPYTAILICDRILLNRHVILHYTIPKPWSFQSILTGRQNRAKLLARGVLVPLRALTFLA